MATPDPSTHGVDLRPEDVANQRFMVAKWGYEDRKSVV